MGTWGCKVVWGRYSLTKYTRFPTAHQKKIEENKTPHRTKQNAKEMFQILKRYDTTLPK